jgi:hypothetical protein
MFRLRICVCTEWMQEDSYHRSEVKEVWQGKLCGIQPLRSYCLLACLLACCEAVQ